jgi:hypothetical protein
MAVCWKELAVWWVVVGAVTRVPPRRNVFVVGKCDGCAPPGCHSRRDARGIIGGGDMMSRSCCGWRIFGMGFLEESPVRRRDFYVFEECERCWAIHTCIQGYRSLSFGEVVQLHHSVTTQNFSPDYRSYSPVSDSCNLPFMATALQSLRGCFYSLDSIHIPAGTYRHLPSTLPASKPLVDSAGTLLATSELPRYKLCLGKYTKKRRLRLRRLRVHSLAD